MSHLLLRSLSEVPTQGNSIAWDMLNARVDAAQDTFHLSKSSMKYRVELNALLYTSLDRKSAFHPPRIRM